MSAVFQQTFANGMVLLLERMEHVRSAALNLVIGAGCNQEPPQLSGIAGIVADLLERGAGSRDSRALSLALDNLGVDYDTQLGIWNMALTASALAKNVPATLELLADMFRRPLLPAKELPSVKSLALQDLHGLEDEPQRKLMIELRKHYYPYPLNINRLGSVEGIQAVTIDDVRAFYDKTFHPNTFVLSVAGNVEWEPLRQQVEALFGDWTGQTPAPPMPGENPAVHAHLSKETAQTHIGLAWPSVPVSHPLHYCALATSGVLSGGMSSRLFTEVREKRGLCYSIYTTYERQKDRGTFLCYAGTTTERAQETLDVTLHELRRLAEGIDADEVQRVQAGLKSSLIMQEESTSARAAALASDWFYLGRVRSFDEIQSAIDGLTAEGIVEYVKQFPFERFSLVTLGAHPLHLS